MGVSVGLQQDSKLIQGVGPNRKPEVLEPSGKKGGKRNTGRGSKRAGYSRKNQGKKAYGDKRE